MNIWDEPSTPKYILIENGEVQSATLNKMIERMTSIDTIDLQLTQTFLSTYKSFTTTDEVSSCHVLHVPHTSLCSLLLLPSRFGRSSWSATRSRRV